MVTHAGGGHSGRVRFEVIAPARLQVSDCNCSICSKAGYLHLIVPGREAPLLRALPARVRPARAVREARFAPAAVELERRPDGSAMPSVAA